ncbi:fungal hydrophobin [Pluteus cervinus]|uniref:Fungal hydrophobin n=1 Tax=Pluteus cervinus TaxID=181527 RepID=A0ACD3AFY8_9AGAR|nr:fungal hydrophobin [Pluteus cervinus]
MFSRTLSATSVAVLALASVAFANDPSQCNTGSIQCCESTQDASSLTALTTLLLDSLDIDVGSLTALVGLTCSPVTVIGTGGTDCSQQPVCCENDSFNGVVALGCTPINLNL